MIKSRHRWSGWPGAVCADCGVEDAAENALALDWIEFGVDDTIVWKDPLLEEYVTFLNTHCLAEATAGEVDQFKIDVRARENKLRERGIKI
jgi:hypothetical protein